MTVCGLVYVFGAPLLLAPYAAGADPATFPTVVAIATVLLRFVALYSIFDMLNLIHAAGLCGAGDTVYPMLLTLVLAFAAMLLPAGIGCLLLGKGVYFGWSMASLYVLLLGVLMRRRSGRATGRRCA